MRRSKLVQTISAVLLLGLGAACRDKPTEAAPPPPPPPPLPSTGVSASVDPAGGFEFTVNPDSSQLFNDIGPHSIYFPAGALCDPSSTYGPSQWDQPCTPATSPVVIHADTSTVNGRPMVEFSPALRFVGSPDPEQWVVLYLADPVASDPVFGPSLRILYRRADSGVENEAKQDPSLATQVDPSKGFVFRRIKHFSGYLVAL